MYIAGTEINLKHKALEIYLSGCKYHHCEGCHNPELWNFEVGDFCDDAALQRLTNKLQELLQAKLVSSVWILGGEPLDQHPDELFALLATLDNYTNNIVLWTHYGSVPEVFKPYIKYAKLGPYIASGQSYTEPVLGIKLANKEQRVVLLKEPTMCANLLIKKVRQDAVIPQYAKDGDAGFDLHACETVTVRPHQKAIVPTGLAFAVPVGCEMQIRMRSGAALKTPLIVANAPGTIDSGYRGEVGIIVRNLGDNPYTVNKGDRIAQGIIAPVVHVSFRETEELPSSERGADGYGSTGK